ncbi:glycoside hydrolase family 128 protein [Tilletiaria anomala UBC 951]|uniref:Glycoside hydrolase family 128 protein n=1 Tax=Tilletiaria anomala (strain ATCC 24038 / CBS 436.72 / UBC 951) TaxID=1037660 RepID=A0A066WK29_TILAU|nr:glycoside hydrolase family 128 protein [Tilletiaria anomala UBC 951]KDN52918.1 glycoside hydrolase family 128 protein [Tilletiaria anomala UBC 951]
MRFSGSFLAGVATITAAALSTGATLLPNATSLSERGTTSSTKRGLAWAADSRWAPTIAKGMINWYWHWEDGPLTVLNGQVAIEYVPCYWGPRKSSQWSQRKAEFSKNGLPAYILAQNEIDVSSQANQGASDAAATWAKSLAPYQAQGVKITSPQIVWNVKLLQETASILKSQYGLEWDVTAIHWYGGSDSKSLASFKSYVQKVRSAFPNKPIWVTELGVTTASGGTQDQVKTFHMNAIRWLNSLGYVDRVSWFGCFATPPDNYGSKLNRFFNSNGSLRGLAYWYMYTS